MVQKYLSDNRIFWISIVFVIGGIFLPAFSFQESSQAIQIIGIYSKSLLEVINVSIFGLEREFALEVPYGKSGALLQYNSLNFFFYILLLFGALFFKESKSKETRLLRYIFSIIFVSKLITLGLAVIFVLVYFQSIQGIFYLHTFLNFMVTFIHLALIYGILQYINSKKTLETVTHQYGEKESVVLVETSKWTRFFHHIMDNFTMVLVFSGTLYQLAEIQSVRDFLNSIANILGEQPTLVLVIALWRMLYYFIFEATLGITGAKLLSETRVVNEEGTKPSAGKIAGRTLLRIVPFEAFSFFMASGLHDKGSQTYVVNEKRTGVKGGWYFLIFPIVLLLGLSIWYGIETYQEIQYEKQIAAEELQKKEGFNDKIQNPTTQDIYKLQAQNYDHEGLYLKVEKIEKDHITFVILDTEKDYKPYFGENYLRYQFPDRIEEIYRIESQNPETIRLSKKTLINANEVTGEDYYRKKNGVFVFGKQFEISEIEAYFGPRLVISYTENYGDNVAINLSNQGWPVDVISVSKFKPEMGQLPLTLNKTNYQSVVLLGEAMETFEFDIKVKDTLNRILTYKITKKEDMQPTIKRMK